MRDSRLVYCSGEGNKKALYKAFTQHPICRIFPFFVSFQRFPGKDIAQLTLGPFKKKSASEVACQFIEIASFSPKWITYGAAAFDLMA